MQVAVKLNSIWVVTHPSQRTSANGTTTIPTGSTPGELDVNCRSCFFRNLTATTAPCMVGIINFVPRLVIIIDTRQLKNLTIHLYSWRVVQKR